MRCVMLEMRVGCAGSSGQSVLKMEEKVERGWPNADCVKCSVLEDT